MKLHYEYAKECLHDFIDKSGIGRIFSENSRRNKIFLAVWVIASCVLSCIVFALVGYFIYRVYFC